MYNDKYSNCWCTVHTHTHTQIVFWCCELCANRWLQSGCFCCCWFFYDSSKSETCVQSFTWKFSRFSCQLASLCLCLCVHVFFIFFSNQTSFFLFHCMFATLFVFVFVFLLLAACLHFLCSQCVLCARAHTRFHFGIAQLLWLAKVKTKLRFRWVLSEWMCWFLSKISAFVSDTEFAILTKKCKYWKSIFWAKQKYAYAMLVVGIVFCMDCICYER